MANATLYELTDELLTLDALLEETEGELTPELEEWWNEYDTKSREKVDRICGFYRDLEARAAAKKAEAKELARKAGVEERKAERVKGLLDTAMTRLGTRELQGMIHKARRQKHGGKRAFSIVLPADQLPDAYRRAVTTYVPLTDALREIAESAIPKDYEGPIYLYREEDLPEDSAIVPELEPLSDVVPIAVLQPRGESIRIA